MNKSKCFPDVKSTYGAPNGRRDILPSGKVKLRLCCIKWTSGAYDQGGAHWGFGDGSKGMEHNIYCAYNVAGVRMYVRANGRRDAASMVLKDCEDGSTCGGYIIINNECVSLAIRKSQSTLCKDRIKWHEDNRKGRKL